jgi:hypothetical protein
VYVRVCIYCTFTCFLPCALSILFRRSCKHATYAHIHTHIHSCPHTHTHTHTLSLWYRNLHFQLAGEGLREAVGGQEAEFSVTLTEDGGAISNDGRLKCVLKCEDVKVGLLSLSRSLCFSRLLARSRSPSPFCTAWSHKVCLHSRDNYCILRVLWNSR